MLLDSARPRRSAQPRCSCAPPSRVSVNGGELDIGVLHESRYIERPETCLANHAWRVTQTIVTGHQRSPPPPIALPDCSHGRSSRVAAGPRRPAKLRRSPRLPRARCRWCHVEIGFGDGISTHTPHLPAGMMRSYGSALRPNCLAKPATVSVWVAPNVAVDSGSSRLITYAVGRPPIAVPTAATTARKNTTSPAWTAE